MSQTACGFSLSGLWKMNKKQSIPMLFAALQEVGDLQRQIKELKLERARDTIAEVRSARDRAISENKKLKEEIKKLQEEYEQYALTHCCEMNCEKCGLTTTEDDLGISLEYGSLICEDCHEQEKDRDAYRKKLQEENKKLKEIIDKLQKENKEYEFESCESVVTSQKVYGQAFAIQAERDKLQEENKKLKEENKKLQETVAEQANDLFFIMCEEQAGGSQVMDTLGYGAEWAEEVKDAMRRKFHRCPVKDVDLDEMFKRYLEWANIDLSEEE